MLDLSSVIMGWALRAWRCTTMSSHPVPSEKCGLRVVLERNRSVLLKKKHIPYSNLIMLSRNYSQCPSIDQFNGITSNRKEAAKEKDKIWQGCHIIEKKLWRRKVRRRGRRMERRRGRPPWIWNGLKIRVKRGRRWTTDADHPCHSLEGRGRTGSGPAWRTRCGWSCQETDVDLERPVVLPVLTGKTYFQKFQ